MNDEKLQHNIIERAFLTLTLQTSPEGVLDEILRQVQHFVPHNAANIMLLQEGALRIVRWEGYQPFGAEEMIATLEQFLANFPLDAEVVHSRQPLVIADVEQESRWVQTPASAWIRSFVAMPLCRQGQVLGLLRLDSNIPHSFTATDVERLQPLADAAAIALEKVRLYDQVRQELTERKQVEEQALDLSRKLLILQYIGAAIASSHDLQYILNTVTREMTNLVEAESCAILTWDPAANIVSTIASYNLADEGEKKTAETVHNLVNFPFANQVLLERCTKQITVSQIGTEPAHLAYMHAARIKTLLMLPMEFQDQVLGLVEIRDSRVERTFAVDEIALIQLLTNQTAVAIRNVRLYDRTRQEIIEHKRVEAIHKQTEEVLAAREARLLAEMQAVLLISRALVSETDLNKLLELIITQAGHLMNTAGAAILLLSDDEQRLEVAAPDAPQSPLKPGSSLPVQGSLAELAITSQKVQISNCPHEDDLSRSIYAMLAASDCRALLCAPLTVQSKTLGVLLIWSKHEQIFTQHDSRLINLFTDQAALALHNAHLYIRNRQLAIQKERQRLARELHDSVTQSIYSIGLAAQSLLWLLEQDADSRLLREPGQHIHTLAQTALTEMREQLDHLHPTVLNEDLVETLTQHCKMLSERYSLNIKLETHLKTSLSISLRDGLYNIAREALWNIVKHAYAKNVNVTLTHKSNQVVLSVEDNGVGFDLSTFVSKKPMGLRNMEERATLLGGYFTLQSKPGEGTRLMVRIPI